MNTQHTPGPWWIDSRWPFSIKGEGPGSSGVPVANAGVGEPNEAEANARLIAAAPDLLAVCIDLHTQGHACALCGSEVEHCEPDCALRAAIAKATGGEA